MWNTSPDPESQTLIKQPFSEKYIVLQESEITMGSLLIKTVTELRWDVRVTAIKEEGCRLEILTLDNVLLQTNNPHMREVSILNNAFKKMYSELDVTVSKKGEVLQVNNMPTIQRKWEQVKAEMQAIQTRHQSLDGIVALNDDIFASTPKVTEAVKNNEFFDLYFHKLYGTRLPADVSAKKKSLFMQADVSWRYQFTRPPVSGQQATVSLYGTAQHLTDTKWLKQAYGQFPMADAATLRPQLAEEGNYVIEHASGRLLKAAFQRQEIAHPQLLKASMKYTITADSYSKQESEKKQHTPPTTTPSNGGFSWIIDN